MGGDTENKENKEILTRERSGKTIRYIALNENGPRRLPVTRIIVGPQPDQSEAAKQIAAATDAPVVISETPYLNS